MTVEAASSPRASYRSLLEVDGIPRVIAGALLGRIGAQMLAVAVVLFALERFHSATTAGLVVFAAIFPGLVLSPIAGALLDQRGRARLIVLDYLVAASALVLIVVLSSAGVLSAALLLAITTLSSLTNPLSNTGTRTLLPLLVPRRLWDRANAADSTGFIIAVVIGPALAGAVAGAVNPSAALLVAAAVFVAAAVVLVGIRDPGPPRTGSGRLLGDAVAGLRYVLRNPSLRALGVGVCLSNLGFGVAVVALPVLVIDHLHSGSATVGLLWAASGLAGAVSGIVVGHLGSEGRERTLLVIGMTATGVCGLILVAAHSVAIAVVAMLVFGIGEGPVNVALFSLRQRRTDPAWLGRAFAVSVSINFGGVPLGSAIGGPLISVSLSGAFLLLAACQLPAIACVLAIPPAPATDPRTAATASRPAPARD